jgi:AbrB family looped-hinge helix DNA binding protein
MTSKGRLTVPKKVRENLGLKAGDRVTFVEQADGSFVMRAATNDIRALKGCLPPPAKQITLQDMRKAVVRRALRTALPKGRRS